MNRLLRLLRKGSYSRFCKMLSRPVAGTGGDLPEESGAMQFRCRGDSMRPFIPPGSVLRVREAEEGEVFAGDVLCYVDREGPVAHRVIGIRDTESGVFYDARGDAFDIIEEIPSTAAVYIVETVEHPLFSYRTDSAFGRMIAQSAVAGGLRWFAVRRAARLAQKLMMRLEGFS